MSLFIKQSGEEELDKPTLPNKSMCIDTRKMIVDKMCWLTVWQLVKIKGGLQLTILVG